MRLEVSYRSDSINIFRSDYAIGTYHLFYIHEGTGKLLVDGLVYDVTSGNAIFLNERRRYSFIPEEKGNNLVYTKVVLNKIYLKGLLAQKSLTGLMDLFNDNEHSSIRTIIEEENKWLMNLMLKKIKTINWKESKLNAASIDALIVYLLTELSRCSLQIIEGKSHYDYSEKRFLEEVFFYIEQNYTESIVLDDISQTLNISKSYMSRTFKKLMGISVIDYLYEYRIHQSKEQLMSRDLTISEIASKNGFKTTPHFSRIFKKYEGVAPSEYIKLFK